MYDVATTLLHASLHSCFNTYETDQSGHWITCSTDALVICFPLSSSVWVDRNYTKSPAGRRRWATTARQCNRHVQCLGPNGQTCVWSAHRPDCPSTNERRGVRLTLPLLVCLVCTWLREWYLRLGLVYNPGNKKDGSVVNSKSWRSSSLGSHIDIACTCCNIHVTVREKHDTMRSNSAYINQDDLHCKRHQVVGDPHCKTWNLKNTRST